VPFLTVAGETTSDSLTSGFTSHPLDDDCRSVPDSWSSGPVSLAGNISSSGLQGIVTPIPRRSLVYEISCDLDRRSRHSRMLVGNGIDVTRHRDDRRHENEVHVSGTCHVEVGLRHPSGLESSSYLSDDLTEKSGVRRLVESPRLRRQASDDVSAVSSKKSRFNCTDGADDPKRNVENGNENSRINESVGSPSQLSDDQSSTCKRVTYEKLSPTRSFSSKSVAEGYSRASAFQVLTQEVERARSTGSCLVSPRVGSADGGGRLQVDGDADEFGELKFHRSGSTSADAKSTVSGVTSDNLDRRAPVTSLSSSTVVTGE